MTSSIILALLGLIVAAQEANSLPSTDLTFRFFGVELSSAAKTKAVSVTTDSFGNTFVSGNTHGSFGKPDSNNLSSMSLFLAKFSKSGYMVWATRTGSAQSDHAFELFYFGGKIYIVGSTKGNIARESSQHEKSEGVQDGFALAYNSFTGKQVWGTQFGVAGAWTEVNSVTVSRSTGVLITGKSNGSLFRSQQSSTNPDSMFFIARLNHVFGTVEVHMQGSLNMPSEAIVPSRMITSRNGKYVHFLLESKYKYSFQSFFVTLWGASLRVANVLSLGERSVQRISLDIAEDINSGNVILSQSVLEENQKSRDFAIQQVTIENGKASLKKIDRIDMSFGSDDVCVELVVNSAGYAIIVGTILDGSESGSGKVATWIYDLRSSSSYGTYFGSSPSSESMSEVVGIELDNVGNVAFAGFRKSSNGVHELLLGTFGIPLYLQTSNRTLGAAQSMAELPIQQGNTLVENDTPGMDSSNGNVSTTEKEKNVSTKGILIIALVVLSVVCSIALSIWCLFRWYHRKGST